MVVDLFLLHLDAPAGTTLGQFGVFSRTPGTRIAALELLLLAYLLVCKVWIYRRSLWGEFPFLSFFAFGLLAMSIPSLREAWSRARLRRRVAVAAVP